MSEKTLNLVRHRQVHAYERIGWVRQPALDVDFRRGEWLTMEWKGDGEPVIPFRIDPAEWRPKRRISLFGSSA